MIKISRRFKIIKFYNGLITTQCDKNLENMSYNREDRQMFDAKCGDCGTDCQVPFQPKEDRPVYCRECFQNHRLQNKLFWEKHSKLCNFY